jgi:hypothetical protein
MSLKRKIPAHIVRGILSAERGGLFHDPNCGVMTQALNPGSLRSLGFFILNFA